MSNQLVLVTVLLLAAVSFYVYSAMALMTIARKTDTPKSWLAWIPVANIHLTGKIAGVSRGFAGSGILLLLFFMGSLFLPHFPGRMAFSLSEILIVLLVGTVFISALGSPLLLLLIAVKLYGVVAYTTIITLVGAGEYIPGIGSLSVLFTLSGLLAGVVILTMHTFMWSKTAETREKPEWFSLLLLIPVINMVFLGVIAWKD